MLIISQEQTRILAVSSSCRLLVPVELIKLDIQVFANFMILFSLAFDEC
jgi:hypothetical protein